MYVNIHSIISLLNARCQTFIGKTTAKDEYFKLFQQEFQEVLQNCSANVTSCIHDEHQRIAN